MFRRFKTGASVVRKAFRCMAASMTGDDSSFVKLMATSEIDFDIIS